MNGSLRICLITKQFPPGTGGAETYAYELANGLAECGHQVDVITQWVKNPDETVDTHERVEVRRICKARKPLVTFETLWFSWCARRSIDPERYDVIHGTLMPASTIAVTPLNGIDVPVVLTSHGTSLGEVQGVALETPADYLLKFGFHPMNVAMDWLAGREADAVVAISEHAHNQLVERYGFDSDRVYLIPHGVDTNQFQPDPDGHPAIDVNETTLLYVGRLGARKGLDLVIKSLIHLDDDVKLVIAGTGRHENALRECAAETDVSDRVQFLGYVNEEELPGLYSASDVFVFPSRYEGFGLVILEAMACGTPVVGADAGGIPTAIGNTEAGIIVDRDEESLAKAVNQLIENNNYGDIARSQVCDRDWSVVIENVESIYKELI